jgi:hypothetical protein
MIVDPRRRTAFHEAGHAVLSAAINDKPHHVSIRSAHGTLGRTGQKMFAQPTSLAQVYLAGFAAEHILTGRRPRQYNIETGLAILAHTDPTLISTFEGIEVSDGYGAVLHLLRTGVRPAEAELRREVDRFYEITRESVSAVWPAVKAVAGALLVHEELDREALDEVMGDAAIYLPVFTVQRAHGLLRPARPAPTAVVTDEKLVEAGMKPTAKVTKRRPAATHKPPGDSDPRTKALLRALRTYPKLAPVVVAYEKQAGEPGRKFGKNGLKTKGGKLFALFTQGTLVVKLPNERVAALVAQGVGKPFDPGHGRLMKGWLTIASAKASWVELTKEAHEFVES